jgi:hypothetical protein
MCDSLSRAALILGYAQYHAGGEVIPQVATLPPLTVMQQFQKML